MSDPKSKVEELEAKFAQARAETEAARLEQAARDLEAIFALQAELGEELVRLNVGRFRPGLPAIIAARAPTEAEYRRLRQMVARNGNQAEARASAQDLLAESCWVYPPKEAAELRKQISQAFPGVLPSIALEIGKLADAQRVEEGKG